MAKQNNLSISQTEQEIERLQKSLKNKKYYEENRLRILARQRAIRLEKKLKEENPGGLTKEQEREIRNAKQRAYREDPAVRKRHNEWNRDYQNRPEVIARKIERREANRFKGQARQSSFFNLRTRKNDSTSKGKDDSTRE